MKKKLAYFLVAALSVSMLAGCGSSKSKDSKDSGTKAVGAAVEVELDDVLKGMADATTELNTLSFGIKGEADITASGEGQDATILGNIDLDAKAVKEEPAFEAEGSLSYELNVSGQSLAGDYDLTAYGEAEDDAISVYAKLNDEGWEKTSIEKSEFDEYIEQIESAFAQSNELTDEDLEAAKKYLTLEDKTQIVNDKECYVLTADIDADKIQELIEEAEDYIDEEYATYVEMIKEFDNINISFSIYVDKETYLPAKMDMDITLKGEVQGVEVNVNKLTIEIEIGINDDVEVKAVPDDVKESAAEVSDDYDFDFE